MEKIVFYGTRGSSTLTSQKYMEFGGATTCLMLNLGRTHIMVDCGSGVSNAMNDLKHIDELHLFISHNHIDHIGGIPTLLSACADKKLHIWGKTFQGISVREAISRIMNQSLWPVTIDTYKNVEFHEITSDINIHDITVSNMDSNHPGGCSLFRFDSPTDSIVTCFDFCHLDGFEEKLLQFAKGAKTLIYDGCLSEDDFPEKSNYGHSTPETGARIGKALGCDQVIITHFGVYDDEELTAWEAKVQKQYPFVTFARSGLNNSNLTKMLALGTLFSTEKDSDELLTKIVEMMLDITGADGGTLYLAEGDKLEFKVLITTSKNIRLVRKEKPLGIRPVNINGKNICAASARGKRLINIPDCYSESRYDFSGTFQYDNANDYHTTSVLVVPLIDEYDDVIGVLQLINATDRNGKIVPFRKQDEYILTTIANQAGMSIRNASYSRQINDLLYGFVRVMSLGIDERTPYNANHTRNMVRFAEKFFAYQRSCDGKYKVDDRKEREILVSIWLHDIGKILTPIDIMNKDSRLGGNLKDVENRFERRNLLLRLFLADGTIDDDTYRFLETERVEQLAFILHINKNGYLSDDLKEELDQLYKKTYRELDGSEQLVLTDEEYHQLSTRKNTLTPEERSIMQNHVSLTQKFLSQLTFPKYYDQVPIYAGNHHEFLNGSGYPNHLTAEDLPWPCRLITICDIFEALTAKDRPYKKPIPVDRSFDILYEMADEGKLDVDIIREFEASRAWVDKV